MPRPLRRALLGAAAGVVVASRLAVPTPAYAAGERLKPEWCALDSKVQELAAAPKGPSWVTERLRPDRVWEQVDAKNRRIRGAGVRVAVIDTGAQLGVSPMLTPPALATGQSNEELPKFDLVNYVGDTADLEKRGGGMDCGHATAVVGYINGQSFGAWNFTGMAPGAQVTVMRALGRGQGNETQAAMVQAVLAATDQGFDIINISQSGGDDPGLKAAIARAVAAGVVVVVATGNAGPGAGPSYPAAYPGVIAVGATTRTDTASQVSQSDPRMPVTVAAPGDDVPLLMPTLKRPAGMSDADYERLGIAVSSGQGTSYAAPIVTGVVALMIQKERAVGVRLAPAEVRRRLELTADRPAGAVPDPQLGYGTVNPVNAVFGPFPVARAPQSSAPATPAPAPLEVPAPRDLRPVVIAVGVGSAALLALAGGVVISEALPAMRRRRYHPARPDE